MVNDELTEEELERIDRHVENCLKALPEFLSEERQLNKEENE